MTDVAETLYHRSRAPLPLVLDEADALPPQRPMSGPSGIMDANMSALGGSALDQATTARITSVDPQGSADPQGEESS
jgi:hypothetical protein